MSNTTRRLVSNDKSHGALHVCAKFWTGKKKKKQNNNATLCPNYRKNKMSHYTKNTPVWNVKDRPLWKFLCEDPPERSPDSHKPWPSTLTLLSVTLERERRQAAQRQNASKTASAIWKRAAVNVALYVRCCTSLWLTGESQNRNLRRLRESHCERLPRRSLGSPNSTSRRVLPLRSGIY